MIPSTWRLNLTPDDNGTMLITSPSLPEVTSFAEDESSARLHGLHAIEEAIAGRMADWVGVPTDTAPNDHTGRVLLVTLPLLTSLKLALYDACRDAGISRAELARRLNWSRNSVDRLFKLDHASRLEQIEAAARVLGLGVRADMVALEDA